MNTRGLVSTEGRGGEGASDASPYLHLLRLALPPIVLLIRCFCASWESYLSFPSAISTWRLLFGREFFWFYLWAKCQVLHPCLVFIKHGICNKSLLFAMQSLVHVFSWHEQPPCRGDECQSSLFYTVVEGQRSNTTCIVPQADRKSRRIWMLTLDFRPWLLSTSLHGYTAPWAGEIQNLFLERKGHPFVNRGFHHESRLLISKITFSTEVSCNGNPRVDTSSKKKTKKKIKFPQEQFGE